MFLHFILMSSRLIFIRCHKHFLNNFAPTSTCLFFSDEKPRGLQVASKLRHHLTIRAKRFYFFCILTHINRIFRYFSLWHTTNFCSSFEIFDLISITYERLKCKYTLVDVLCSRQKLVVCLYRFYSYVVTPRASIAK